MNAHQKETELLMRELLGDSYVTFRATSLAFEENFDSERMRVRCEILNGGGAKHNFSGEGVGLIDAFFTGLKARLSETYPSLKTIVFADFSVKADVATKKGVAGSDSSALIELVVENGQGRRFAFTHSSRSITRSSLEVTMQACSYFVNSELAFVKTRQALEHAKQEKRADSVQRYTMILTQLVENTSYGDLVSAKT
jgi:hypothetical protein